MLTVWYPAARSSSGKAFTCAGGTASYSIGPPPRRPAAPRVRMCIVPSVCWCTPVIRADRDGAQTGDVVKVLG
jgi:hypothetical protein